MKKQPRSTTRITLYKVNDGLLLFVLMVESLGVWAYTYDRVWYPHFYLLQSFHASAVAGCSCWAIAFLLASRAIFLYYQLSIPGGLLWPDCSTVYIVGLASACDTPALLPARACLLVSYGPVAILYISRVGISVSNFPGCCLIL